MTKLITYFIFSILTYHAKCQVNIGISVDKLFKSKYEEGTVYAKINVINFSSDTIYISNQYVYDVCVGDSIVTNCSANLMIKNYSNLLSKEGIDKLIIRPGLPQSNFIHNQKLQAYKKKFLDFNNTNLTIDINNQIYFLVKPISKISYYIELNTINHDFELLYFIEERRMLLYSEFRLNIKYKQAKYLSEDDYIYCSKSNKFKILMK